MLVGAYGERAIELLEPAARQTDASLDRVGSLAVLGPSGASEEGWRCWIWGRVANVDALRERFAAPADLGPTALVAHAHARLGLEACDLLRGTFLLVASERGHGLAVVVRDQLGGRPLVYTSVRGGVLFAEHERDLLEVLPSTPAPDRLTLAQWADRGTSSPGRTLYEGVHRLPPGHRLNLAVPQRQGRALLAASLRRNSGQRARGDRPAPALTGIRRGGSRSVWIPPARAASQWRAGLGVCGGRTSGASEPTGRNAGPGECVPRPPRDR